MKEKLKLLDARFISDNGFVYFNHDFKYWEKEILSYIEEKCKHRLKQILEIIPDY